MLYNSAKQWNPEVEHPKIQNLLVTWCFLLHPFRVQWVWLGFFLVQTFPYSRWLWLRWFICPTVCHWTGLQGFCYLLFFIFPVDWEKQWQLQWRDEFKKIHLPVVCAKGAARGEVSPAFQRFLGFHCPALPFCTEGICVENTLCKNGASLGFFQAEVLIKNSKT